MMKEKRPRRKAADGLATARSQKTHVGPNPMFSGLWDEAEAKAQQAAADAYLGRLWHSNVDDPRVQREIGRLVGILLGTLTNCAGKGQESGIALLLDIVRSGIDSLNLNAGRHTRAYVRVAECQNLWPVLVTPHRDSFVAAQTFVERIRLGTKTGVGYTNRKAFGWRNESAIVASLYLELFTRRNFPERYAIRPDERCDRLISKFPVLSRNKTVIGAWWKSIWMLFETRYGPAYETDPAFAHHWTSASFAPKTVRGDSRRYANQRSAASIYAELMEWWLYASYGRRSPRVVWPGHDPSNQAGDYPPMPKGSWQHAAVRLPKLTRRRSVMDEWFEAARLLNRDRDSDYFETLSNADFAPYMENALRRVRGIRGHVKDLLEQAVTSIAQTL